MRIPNRTMTKLLRSLAAAALLFGAIVPGVFAQSVVYLHTDLIGTPVVATGETGATVWTKKYSAYGAESGGSGSATSSLGFTSGLFDADAGLVYLHNRNYDPTVGRFMSVDPAGFTEANVQSFNRYAYAVNNPYRFRDKDGQWAEDAVIGAISLTVGTVSLGNNLLAHNWWMAAVDVVGIVHDVVACAVPGYPGWAGSAIQASRLAARGATTALKTGTVEVIELAAREGAPIAAEVAAKGAQFVDKVVPGAIGRATAGAAQVVRTLQTGGNKMLKQTADALNDTLGKSLGRRDWGRALEELKGELGLPADHHGQILSTGDYVDDAGNVLGNLLDYIP